VTNVTFIFQTSPNTNLYDKKVGGHGILCPPRLKKWGTRPPCPPPNCAHGCDCTVDPIQRDDEEELWQHLSGPSEKHRANRFD